MNPIPKTLAIPFLSILATTVQAELLVNESFSDYTGENLSGNVVTATGLTGSWSGSGFFKNQAASLTMTGVASSGGSLTLNEITVQGKSATAAFNSPLPTSTLFGSYLFTTTIAASNARSVGGMGVGGPGNNDNNAAFVWSGNCYNSVDQVEGPEIRVAGKPTLLPELDFTFISGQTYLFLFEFNGAEGTTSGWVLNQSQLTNFYDSLDATTLNAAATDTEDPDGVVWAGTVEGIAAAEMSHLILFGYTPNTAGAIVYEWDEIRISDTSLLEAAKGVQAPASDLRILNVTGGPGEFTITYEAGGANVNIERSSPGLDNFQVIATDENSGTFIDTSAPEEKAFYRIQIAE